MRNNRTTAARYFDYRVRETFLDIVEDILDRVDDVTNTEEIWQAIDDGLIYTADQWEVLKFYPTPQAADWDAAIKGFYYDISAICDMIADEASAEYVQVVEA